MIKCTAPSYWLSDFSLCLFEWQTLISGLAAVIIGGITIWQVRRQVRHQFEMYDLGRQARLSVARAKLPIASSAAARHAKQCVAALDAIEPAIVNRSSVAEPAVVPLLPFEIQKTFDDLIAETSDPNAQFAVAAIYAEQQVLSARLEEIHVNPRAHCLSIDYYYLQPVIIHALAMSLLAYGRRDSATVDKIGWADLLASAKSLLRSPAPRQRVLTLIEGKASRGIKLPFALSTPE